MVDVLGLDIERLNHDSFKVEGNGKTVYFDPFKIGVEDEADVVFVGHEHFDHCSREDIEKVSGPDTVLVVNNNSLSKVSKIQVRDVKAVGPGQSLDVAGLGVETVPAYNVNKFKSPGHPFHPKGDGHCGYIVDFGGVKVYHMGDTDNIEELSDIECDIALVPVSGTYVMTAEEAAEAMKKVQPKVAIPMHYGAIVGDESDAERFKELADCEVVIA